MNTKKLYDSLSDSEKYILEGLCDGNCYKCILPCEDRDKPLNYIEL